MHRIKIPNNKIISFFVILGVISLIIGVYQCVLSQINSNHFIWAYNNDFSESGLNEGIYQGKSKEDIIRFHVIANSNSSKDQNIKLKVRKLVLEDMEDKLKNIYETGKAKRILKEEKNRVSLKAEAFLQEKGYNYNVETKVLEEYFPTRRYNKGVLEGDKYIAFKLIIGNGKGENWWCVLFPPLCYVDLVVREESEAGEADEVDNDGKSGKEFEKEEVNEEDKEIKFYIYEWIKNLL